MHSYHTQLQNSPQPTDIKPRPQHLSSSSALSSPSLILRSTERSKFPSRCDVYKALFFLHDNLVQNSPTEQGRKHLPNHVSMITDAKNETHMGTAGKPQAAREHRPKRTQEEGREAQQAQGSYQVPEALVFAWVLAAQNICRQTVHLAHVQPDPVKEVEEERAGWEETHKQWIPLSRSRV